MISVTCRLQSHAPASANRRSYTWTWTCQRDALTQCNGKCKGSWVCIDVCIKYRFEKWHCKKAILTSRTLINSYTYILPTPLIRLLGMCPSSRLVPFFSVRPFFLNDSIVSCLHLVPVLGRVPPPLAFWPPPPQLRVFRPTRHRQTDECQNGGNSYLMGQERLDRTTLRYCLRVSG